MRREIGTFYVSCTRPRQGPPRGGRAIAACGPMSQALVTGPSLGAKSAVNRFCNIEDHGNMLVGEIGCPGRQNGAV